MNQETELKQEHLNIMWLRSIAAPDGSKDDIVADGHKRASMIYTIEILERLSETIVSLSPNASQVIKDEAERIKNMLYK